MYFWETSILGNESRKEKDSDKTYVVYKLVVQDDSQSWTIERRYNDFYALHARLKEKFSESQLPPVPPKGFQIFTNNDPAFLKERAVALEKYLRLLLKKDAPTCQCGDVLDFLDPNRKSSLNSSLPIEASPVTKYKMEPLPPLPPRLFVLNQESTLLPDGEEVFLPQFFDHIAESIKYLLQVDNRITSALSAQSKMHIYEVEKERIESTISTLTEQQRVTNQILETTTAPSAPFSPSNRPMNNNNNNNYNDYSVYNTYTNNNNNNNYNNMPPPSHTYGPPPPLSPNGNRAPPPPYYGPPLSPTMNRPPPSPYYGPPPTMPFQPPSHAPYFPQPPPHSPYSPAPPPHSPHYPPPSPVYSPPPPRPSEGALILTYYLKACLTHIHDAIIWESGLEGVILAECVNSNGWCEILERLKWFDAECEKLIVGSLGVALPKEAKKELKKKIKNLSDQASKYHEELSENPKHKCGLPPNTEMDHVEECRMKIKKTLDFINENRKRLSGSSAEDIVVKYESKMFKILEDIANLEAGKYITSEERKDYRDKASDIRKAIAKLMKKVSDLRVDLQGELTKLLNHEGDKTNLPNESSVLSLINRLEDLQANLADLSHDFSKALEIAQRGGLGGLVLEKQLDDVRKTHEQNDNDMFEL